MFELLIFLGGFLIGSQVAFMFAVKCDQSLMKMRAKLLFHGKRH